MKKLIIFLALTLNLHAQEWGELNGPPGGDVNAIAVNPLDPDIVFAGTKSQILFKSTNAGETSSILFNENGFLPFSSEGITFDPVYSQIIYAGAYKSTDGGESWNKLNTIGGSLTINPLQSKKMYSVFYDKQLQVSENGGETWSLLYEFQNSLDKIVISPADTSILYAAADDGMYGIYLSTDSGISWQRTNSPIEVNDVTCIKINPKNFQELWVSTLSGIYKTNDSGESWRLLSNEAYINEIVINPMNTDVVYYVSGNYLTLTGNVFKTIDGGTTWEKINTGLPGDQNRIISCLAINPLQPDELFVGTIGYGVYQTNNGGVEWYQTNLTKAPVTGLSFHPENVNYIYAGTYNEGMMYSTNGGQTWGQLNLGLPVTIQAFCREIKFSPQNYETAYMAAGKYGVLKSIDGGTTWNQTSLTGSFDINIWSLALHPVNPDIVYCGTVGYMGRDLYKSTDAGNTWCNMMHIDGIFQILIDDYLPDNVYVCATGHGFYKSTDNGNTWAQFNHGLKTTDYPLVSNVQSVAIGETNNILYIAQRRSIRKSTNYGNSWFAIDSSLSIIDNNFTVRDVCVPPDNPGILFAALSSGVYVTANSGANWERIFNGSCNAIKVDPHNSSRLYIVTEGGLFTIDDYTLLSVDKQSDKLSSHVVLYQNYPNPFNVHTSIKYKLHESGKVVIRIFDLLGQEIKSFYNHHNSQGEYSIFWDGKNREGGELSSGVYFYIIITKFSTITKKLVLLK